ncbi:MAG: hypothetical protein EX270_03710 [Pseudomonadales bacterium]|nr:MAG: hypothetical protein EX270_03710 [Pseudomonadales bacterium]
MSEMRPAVDAGARSRALDTSISCVVTAPAGSGKTELLTQRLLALLAVVDEPEEVLAITFTRKAAGEMRARVLGALALGEQEEAPGEPYRLQTWQLARAVLQRDEALGWALQSTPARLRLQTIDSLCQRIAGEQPVLSLLGGALRPQSNAEWLYQHAVDALLAGLERRHQGDQHLRLLADFYHGDLRKLAAMLVAMLRIREQWLSSMVHLSADAAAIDELQACLSKWCAEILQQARDRLQSYAPELLEVAEFAATTLKANPALGPNSLIRELQGIEALPEPTLAALPAWRGLLELLLTGSLKPRAKISKAQGFPVDREYGAAAIAMSKRHKQNLKRICEAIGKERATLAALQAVAGLPEHGFTENYAPASASTSVNNNSEQPAATELLVAISHCLLQLVAQLQLVFAEQGCCDHTEVTLAALRVLDVSAAQGAGETMQLMQQQGSGAYAWHRRLRHILVDEYQDTSLLQYRLLCALTCDWAQINANGEGRPRTVFLVGDAMQSIYAFREARVQLFLSAKRGCFGDIPLQRIDLLQNFRSSASLVDWFNGPLGAAFPAHEDTARGGVTFSPAVAYASGGSDKPMRFYACVGEHAAQLEAQKIVQLVTASLESRPGSSIAILVKKRGDLRAILPALRAAGIEVQNSDIDLLVQREQVADCLLLARAFMASHDDVAWWALLRAPWCGLGVAVLQQLRRHFSSCKHCGAVPVLLERGVAESTEADSNACKQFLQSLPVDARERLQHLSRALPLAGASRGHISLRERVENCWIALGGRSLVARATQPDAAVSIDTFFDELEAYESECRQREEQPGFAGLQKRVQALFAEQQSTPGAGVHAMTIFKSKGLEFDTVILPAMSGTGRGDPPPLIQIAERVFADGSSGVLLYPRSAETGTASKAGPKSVYQFLNSEKSLQSSFETTRLLYVAATRARHELLLTACMEFAKPDASGAVELAAPAKGSLLACLWPALQSQAVVVEQAMSNTSLAQAETRSPRSLKRLALVDIRELAQRETSTERARSFNTAPFAARAPTQKPANLQSSTQTTNLPASSAELAVGSCAHELLQLAFQRGERRWCARDIDALAGSWQLRLAQLGVPPAQMPHALQRLQRAMQGALLGSEGLKLLECAGRNGRAEWELLACVDDSHGWQRSRIDLAFIDEDGQRWIVDYKISEPEPGEAIQAFLEREQQCHAEQLAQYAATIAILENRSLQSITTALYFPLIDRILPMPGR